MKKNKLASMILQWAAAIPRTAAANETHSRGIDEAALNSYGRACAPSLDGHVAFGAGSRGTQEIELLASHGRARWVDKSKAISFSMAKVGRILLGLDAMLLAVCSRFKRPGFSEIANFEERR